MAIPEKGIIYAATGQIYVDLATRSAESCRTHMPDVPIDLYTDAPIEAGPFDKVHILEDPWKRSKIDAMASSRFAKTIFLDADTYLLDSILEVFDVLDRFDIAGAHDPLRNSWNARKIYRTDIPEAFPQVNTGMLAFRRKKAVTDLLREWSRIVRDEKMWRDQPVFRDLLWESNLRLLILPEEYNFLALYMLRAFVDRNGDPRVIHSPSFHHKIEDASEIVPVEEVLGMRYAMVEKLRKKRQSMLKRVQRRRKNL